MLNVFGLSAAQFETFLLVFIRVSAMLTIFPVFAAPQIPRLARFGLAGVISFIIYRTTTLQPMSGGFYEFGAAVLSQIVLGMVVGFVASLVFTGIQFAGEMLDLQIGFAVANVINPTTQQQVTIVGEFQLAIATLIFLMTDAHHLLLQGIAGSFTLLPLPYIQMDPSVGGHIVNFMDQAFQIVFKIAAPAAVSLFVVNVALAFMARVAPQMNVFVVGLPLQIGVGMIMLAVSLPLLTTVAPQLYADVAHQMDTVMRGMRPPG